MQSGLPTISLRVTDDQLSVLLESYPVGEEPEALTEKILAEMPRLNLRLLPSRETLTARLQEAHLLMLAEGRVAKNVLVVQGTPAAPSRDAEIEWTGDYFNDAFAIDEKTGRVDYRRRQMVPGVETGQLLGRLTPAREGTPGCNVFGMELGVRRPKRIKVKPGPGVRMAEEKGIQSFYATRAGRVRWALGTLAVDDLLQIHGNVGLETGDITHPGAVMVEGNVQAGSRLTASGDVEILGVLESAEVTVGGNLIVHGGVTGGDGCRIRVGGSLQARFVQEAEIETGGDVVVASEFLNTTLHANGALRLPQGRVVGGQVSARRGITVRQAGSEAHARTVLLVGHDAKLAPVRAEKEARINELKGNILKIQHTINPLMARQSRLSAEQREHVTVLMLQVYEMEAAVKEAQAEYEELLAAEQELSASKIVVYERAFAETVFQIKTEKLAIIEDMAGPAVAFFHHGRVSIRRRPAEGESYQSI